MPLSIRIFDSRLITIKEQTNGIIDNAQETVLTEVNGKIKEHQLPAWKW